MNRFEQELSELKEKGSFRSIPPIEHEGKYIIKDNQKLVNLSGNDYLGLASRRDLLEQFKEETQGQFLPYSSSSSRLLTGNFPIYEQLESLIAASLQHEAALLFNSGYHANIGILPAITTKRSLIVADKLVHASLIDGIRLSNAQFVRYKHNDNAHLQKILEKEAANYDEVFIVTESLFSMDGDIADLRFLVAMKQRFNNVYLYVDEAHAIGVRGNHGYGIAEEQGVLADIDFLVGTFGKALASMGAYVACTKVIRDYLINTMRPLIFSTTLPPVTIAWSYFIFKQLPLFGKEREHLEIISKLLRDAIAAKGVAMPSESNIIPYIIGENKACIDFALQLQKLGVYALPVRPPTVPVGTSRIRFSLSAAIAKEDIEAILSGL